jgi:hypothetical protein
VVRPGARSSRFPRLAARAITAPPARTWRGAARSATAAAAKIPLPAPATTFTIPVVTRPWRSSARWPPRPRGPPVPPRSPARSSTSPARPSPPHATAVARHPPPRRSPFTAAAPSTPASGAIPPAVATERPLAFTRRSCGREMSGPSAHNAPEPTATPDPKPRTAFPRPRLTRPR